MKINLVFELKAVGLPMDREEFRELLADMFANMHPGWTDEDLLCRPDDAKRFCMAIQRRLVMKFPESQKLSDYAICRSLQAIRKSGNDLGVCIE